MIKRVGFYIAFLAVSILLCQCGGPAPTSTGSSAVKDDPSFSHDIQRIFDSYGCSGSGCHDIGTAQVSLILASGHSYSSLVGVNSSELPPKKRVAPGDVAGSYLIDKIDGTPAVGDRMPLGMASMNSTDIQMIKNWIIKGAKDN